MSAEVQTEWVPPSTLGEGEELLHDLLAQIQSIQGQLGEHVHTTPEGERLSYEDYTSWRQRAKGALNYKLAEYRRLKAWLAEETKAKNLARVAEETKARGLARVPKRDTLAGNPVDLAKQAARAAGHLYAVFLAAGDFLDSGDDDSYAELVRVYEDARHGGLT